MDIKFLLYNLSNIFLKLILLFFNSNLMYLKTKYLLDVKKKLNIKTIKKKEMLLNISIFYFMIYDLLECVK